MSHLPKLAVNPREIPSVTWSENDSSLPNWTDKQWQALNRDSICTALQKSSNVQGLWKHDLSHNKPLQPAAVLLLLIESPQGYQVVLTTRAQHLRHHAGQVSFVGGRVESGETIEQAALREATEEINLDTSSLEILGVMPHYNTISGFSVYPVVAVMSEAVWLKQSIQLDPNEVDQVFLVPLDKVLDRERIHVHTFKYESNERQFLSMNHQLPEDSFFIWGASMAIMHNFDLILRAHLSLT